MSAPASRGYFVTLEGVEGVGKTTQVERLVRALGAAGVPVLGTREPGGTEFGRKLRALLLDPRELAISPWTELLLYAADRAEHLERLITPALASGTSVLCDRFLDATLAYQGHARGLGPAAVLDVHRHGPLRLRPDRTVLLDLDPETGLERARHRDEASGAQATEGRFEQERLEFHERVRQGYLELAREEPERIAVVDAAGNADEVERRVRAALAPLWPTLAAAPAGDSR